MPKRKDGLTRRSEEPPEPACADCDNAKGMKPECQDCPTFDEGIDRPELGCPDFCSVFECIIPGGECKQECQALKITNKPICTLCNKTAVCPQERRDILLDKRYVNRLRGAEDSSLPKGTRKALEEHKYLERRYKEVKDELYKIPKWNYWSKSVVVGKGSAIRKEMVMMRKIFDLLEIEYIKEVELEPLKKSG
jgi:hypothetical protein